MTRLCSKCKRELPLSEFGKHRQRKDGISLWCLECARNRMRSVRSTEDGAKKHRERERARARANKLANCEKAKDWRDKNLARARASSREASRKRLECPVYKLWERVRQLDWCRRNKAIVTRKARNRQMVQIGATPKWLTAIQKAQIAEFYEISSAITVQAGVWHSVDHIHPIRGENFCGLHVPWNLQVISHSENSSKAHKIPEEFREQFFEAA